LFRISGFNGFVSSICNLTKRIVPLEKVVGKLSNALALEAREHLALVGGGGKTKLMFALAEELCQAKKRVVTTTTTKIWHREAMISPSVAFIQSDSSWRDRLRKEVQRHGYAFLAQSLLESGKVNGISPSLADELYNENAMDYLIVEADGSAGHPVKAPAEHEPVIPSSVTKVVGMLGLEAMGQQVGPEIVFRVEHFRKLTGLITGQRITPSVLSKLFLDPDGLFKGTPVSAKRIAFLNKLDLLKGEGAARDLASSILGDNGRRIDRVVIGSLIRGIYLIAEK
jgi:probable selenium-dependent hydroxylase accessory protein YqeC